MRPSTRLLIAGLAARAALAPTAWVEAHGFVGDRFFPPTLATDDPFAVDEFALPEFSFYRIPGNGGPETQAISVDTEFDKEIFPGFALGVADDFIWQRPTGGPNLRGWDQLTIGAKYQIWQNDPHEFIISAGIQTAIGGTGDSNVSESFTTFIPQIYIGKGFGDLPDSLGPAKPLAVTADLGQTFPIEKSDPNYFNEGIAVEYSLPYLEENVEDTGLPAPWKNMIPLVEWNLQTAENRSTRGQTTGTVDPGVLWETDDAQFGAEAVVPLDRRSGSHIGVIFQVWIFIDDIFPKEFGHPLFGGQP
jgi:hypothetical protein